MRARSALLVVASLAACAGAPKGEGTARSPADRVRPEADPALLGAPSGPAEPLPIEEVSVRVRRAADGRVTIVEFLSPGLSEAQRTLLRLDYEAGRFRLAGEGAAGQESWITTLLRSR